MKFAAFDIEIAKELPEDCEDWRTFAPLGVSCIAISRYVEGGGLTPETEFYHAPGRMSSTDIIGVLARLYRLREEGYTILSWNGCSFDFQVLAEESGFENLAGELALTHVDMMLEVTFRKGHYLGLDKALRGAGLVEKQHSVTLKDGSTIDDMGGAKAPAMWAKGEYEAVLHYLRRDVESLLELAEWVKANGCIQWTSGSGKRQRVSIPEFSIVDRLFRLPVPDTSWMTNAPKRTQFVEWIPQVKATTAMAKEAVQ